MLDLLVGGCKQTALCISSVTATQPDVGTGGNPPATLVSGPGNKVTPSVPTDAYTLYVRLKGVRGHITNNLP